MTAKRVVQNRGLVCEIPETSVTGNGFIGTLSAAAGREGSVEVASPTMTGGFCGPYARESGGTVQGGFARRGVDEAGIGPLHGSAMEPRPSPTDAESPGLRWTGFQVPGPRSPVGQERSAPNAPTIPPRSNTPPASWASRP